MKLFLCGLPDSICMDYRTDLNTFNILYSYFLSVDISENIEESVSL